MNPQLPKLGVLLLNHNGRNWLPVIYASLGKQGYPRIQVYLVDNASTDGSVELTLKDYPEVTVLKMPQNLGYCMAYNLAMPYAFAEGCEWVILANNDVKLEPGCLQELARIAMDHPDTGVLGPAFLAWEGDEPNYYMVGNYPQAIGAMKAQSPHPIAVDWVEGSFWMVSRGCIETVGPLDPFLFFYWEETDFCRRARFRGWRVFLVPRALARHFAGGWSKAENQNRKTAASLQYRNYYIYKLANPFQGPVKNIGDALHLLLVNVKAAIFTQPGMATFHLRVFWGVLKEFRRIYEKWNRDRAGKHPAVLRDNMPSLLVQAMGGINGTRGDGKSQHLRLSP